MTSCDFCDATDRDGLRALYECDECRADCCSDHCEHDTSATEPLLLCNPHPESGHTGCYKPPVAEVADE